MSEQLFRAATEAVARHGGGKATRITLRIGALATVTPSGLRQQIGTLGQGSSLEGAEVEIRVSDDPTAPHSDGVVLESVEIEEA